MAREVSRGGRNPTHYGVLSGIGSPRDLALREGSAVSTGAGTEAVVEQSQEVTPDAIMQLGFAFWGSKTLLSAIELGVFTELADAGALGAEELRGRIGLHERSADDFFDALVALGMLERSNGSYANTPSTDLFLDRAK